MKQEEARRELYFHADFGVDVIGDIHGCYEEFIELIEKLGYRLEPESQLYKHPEGRKILSLGDITSRGPESLPMLSFFIRHVKAGLAEMIESNHGWKIARWLDGRRVTLAHGDELVEAEFLQYEQIHGKRKANKLRYDSLELLMTAPSHIILLDKGEQALIAVHAGIKDSYIGKESHAILNFCRYGDVDGMAADGRPIRKDWTVQHELPILIVWGHDPRVEPERNPYTLNIDQGCVFGGKLTAYRYPEDELVSVVAKKNYSGKTDTPLTRELQRNQT
ncbi:metallophosphoesterase [Brevibacillus daliensis]|uniref:metallophosphoesterase n=1 Tax=Brevibacillus daliensis TaxID=2892995 RepID=UPI001E47604F|nr:metallophosphoesterase [Brevibacillus daliensis]